ncbi:MAG: YbaN family protein [Sulfuritalea sp.]|nr:YbaN family protein [Sulfuritalea sp.]
MSQDDETWEIPESELHPSLLVRVVLWTLGSIALLLGIIGIFLPGLPTTPFILVAAACYARASERFYRRLVENPTVGPLIVEWRRHHSIPFRIKLIAITLMSLTICISIWSFSGKPWLQGLLAFIGISTAIVLWRIPSRDHDSAQKTGAARQGKI